jgi:hypothetical protein
MFKKLINKIQDKLLNFYRKQIYKHDYQFLTQDIHFDEYYGVYQSGIYAPVLSVHKVIENICGFECYYRMHIHSIEVNTQLNEIIEITIKLRRPSFLIGPRGMLINKIQDDLTILFNKRVKIVIKEVQDRNWHDTFYMGY